MLNELLKNWFSPGNDLMDLIEIAFLRGEIDGVTAALALSWLENNAVSMH